MEKFQIQLTTKQMEVLRDVIRQVAEDTALDTEKLLMLGHIYELLAERIESCPDK